jgi:hypothetical protein
MDAVLFPRGHLGPLAIPHVAIPMSRSAQRAGKRMTGRARGAQLAAPEAWRVILPSPSSSQGARAWWKSPSRSPLARGNHWLINAFLQFAKTAQFGVARAAPWWGIVQRQTVGFRSIPLRFLKTFCKFRLLRPHQTADVHLICKTWTVSASVNRSLLFYCGPDGGSAVCSRKAIRTGFTITSTGCATATPHSVGKHGLKQRIAATSALLETGLSP